ncbi:hypothetical protein GGR56DRAFT_222872 [Xylariaceae sp. FL0804]|nr:hypothetical protein GGR56DRAFT_222872 [Xylariaceae sp. FL0804]
MSIARALTTRRGKQASSPLSVPQRSNTSAKGPAPVRSIRSQISGPVELTHTTNMLVYNAPDIYPQPESSPSISTKSEDEFPDSPRSSSSSPPTSPDMPSPELSGPAEPNHLSCYFTAPGQKAPQSQADAPAIPKRSPSHTKKASYDNAVHRYVRHSNQSSHTVSSKGSFSLSRSSSTSTTATSVSSVSYAQKSSKFSVPAVPSIPAIASPPARRPSFRRPAEPESQHPFGHELAQVSELAEELGIQDKLQMIDEEEQQLLAEGLHRFHAEDYLAELQGLEPLFFRPSRSIMQAVWI